MKIGLEKEYFVMDKDNNLILCPTELPFDDCGFLVEVRGKPQDNIVDAVFSLMAQDYIIKARAKTLDVLLLEEPIMKIARALKLKAQRIFMKGLSKYQNLYGHTQHKNKISEHTAGVHVSFTEPYTIRHEGEEIETINKVWDFVQLFRKIDSAFKEEIKSAKRNTGFYEIKADGRIEYRSLPNNADLFKLIDVVQKMEG